MTDSCFPPTEVGEPINGALRDHATTARGWELKAVLERWHRWVQILDEEFGFGLETPALTVAPLRRVAGHYRRLRNGFGLMHEIAISDAILAASEAYQLSVLCHEVLHEWQNTHGTPPSLGRNNYHNDEFREEAASLGLIVDRQGRQSVVAGPFTRLLERHGIPTDGLISDRKPAPVAPTTARKSEIYSCGCNEVSARKEVHARCTDCGRTFERGRLVSPWTLLAASGE